MNEPFAVKLVTATIDAMLDKTYAPPLSVPLGLAFVQDDTPFDDGDALCERLGFLVQRRVEDFFERSNGRRGY